MRWRVRTGYPVAVVYLVLADPKPRGILIGAVVAAIGLLIRGASSGHLRKDRELATSGPYAHTRNPLYLGSAFLAAGFAIAGGSWWAGLLVVATAIGTRLPRGQLAKTAGEQLGHVDQPV